MIDADALIQEINKIYKAEEKEDLKWAKGLHYSKAIIRAQPTVDAACVVRCKDCIYWKPPHVRLNDGKQRAYKESDRESDPLGMLSVSMDVGINVGGKCWVDHNTGYSEDKRVFRSKNDFCGKARKLPDGETNESWWGLSEEPSELIDD